MTSSPVMPASLAMACVEVNNPANLQAAKLIHRLVHKRYTAPFLSVNNSGKPLILDRL